MRITVGGILAKDITEYEKSGSELRGSEAQRLRQTLKCALENSQRKQCSGHQSMKGLMFPREGINEYL